MIETARRFVVPCSLAALALTATSCIPESRHPFSDEKTSKRDERLIGRWRVLEDPNDSWVSVTAEPGKNQFAVLGDEEKIALFTTNIEARSYMSAKVPGTASFLILEYSFADKDTLEVRFLDEDRLAVGIAAKELRGKAETTKNYAWLFGFIPVPYETTSVRINDSPEALVRYLKNHGDDAFEKIALLTLRREK